DGGPHPKPTVAARDRGAAGACEDRARGGKRVAGGDRETAFDDSKGALARRDGGNEASDSRGVRSGEFPRPGETGRGWSTATSTLNRKANMSPQTKNVDKE